MVRRVFMSKLRATVDDYDINKIEKKMEKMSRECAEQMATQQKVHKADKPNNKKSNAKR